MIGNSGLLGKQSHYCLLRFTGSRVQDGDHGGGGHIRDGRKAWGCVVIQLEHVLVAHTWCIPVRMYPEAYHTIRYHIKCHTYHTYNIGELGLGVLVGRGDRKMPAWCNKSYLYRLTKYINYEYTLFRAHYPTNGSYHTYPTPSISVCLTIYAYVLRDTQINFCTYILYEVRLIQAYVYTNLVFINSVYFVLFVNIYNVRSPLWMHYRI